MLFLSRNIGSSLRTLKPKKTLKTQNLKKQKLKNVFLKLGFYSPAAVAHYRHINIATT